MQSTDSIMQSTDSIMQSADSIRQSISQDWDNFEGMYSKTHRGDLVNTWQKNPENKKQTILQITNKHHEIRTIVDTDIGSQINQISWSPLRTNRSNKFYIRHGSTDGEKHFYLHEYVMKLNNVAKPQDDGKTYSVDHINRDTLDNRLENLRWATQSDQNINTDKRSRKCNARELPPGIEEEHIPKFVTYNVEVYDKEKGSTRDYFRIEKHPLLTSWYSSKSNKVSIQDKLGETYKKLEALGDVFEVLPEFLTTYDKNPNELAKELGFVLTKDMIPKYVNFVRETEKRGNKFEIAIPGNRRISTSGSKKVTLEEKYNEMILQMNGKNSSN